MIILNATQLAAHAKLSRYSIAYLASSSWQQMADTADSIETANSGSSRDMPFIIKSEEERSKDPFFHPT